MTLTRKEFLGQVVTAVAGVTGAAVLIGCSDKGGSADAGVATNCSTNGAVPAIGSNHPAPGTHTMMMVAAADVNGLADKTYTIQGSTHTHTVTVTAANFTTLKNSPSAIVTAMSSSDGTPAHAHTITITCA